MLTPVERLALWNIASGLRVERQVRRRLARDGYLDENGLTEQSLRALEEAAPRCKWEAPKQQGPVEKHHRMTTNRISQLMLVAAMGALSVSSRRR